MILINSQIIFSIDNQQNNNFSFVKLKFIAKKTKVGTVFVVYIVTM